jgi:hypothetical protein
MSADAASPDVSSVHSSEEPIQAGRVSPPLTDPTLQSIVASAQVRLSRELARARAAGLLDADGNVTTDQWPEDMRPAAPVAAEVR